MVNSDGELKDERGLRRLSGIRERRGYVKWDVTGPRRNASRPKPIEFVKDPLELRAVGGPLSEGSILERIVAKRLSVIWGRMGIDWDYLAVIGMGYNPTDFAVYKRPSGRELALEVQGANWHGPKERWSNVARALDILSIGMDYEEVWEWEIRMGDEYLDTRLMELIGGVSKGVIGGRGVLEEVRSYEQELQAGLTNPG